MAGLPQLGPGLRVVLKVFGCIFLALFTFVFAFQMVFPYNRVQKRIEELAAAKVDLQIGSIERSLIPGRFFLKDVHVKTRPTQTDLETALAIPEARDREKAVAALSTEFTIDSLEVDLHFLPFLSGTTSVDFVAKIDSGKVNGHVAVNKNETEIKISGAEVPSQHLPMREVLSNLPMSGDVDFEFELDLPNDKLKNGKTGPDWTKAVGVAELSCQSNCVIGDGKAKLKLKAKNARSQAFAGDGTAFGTISVQTLDAKIEMKEGKVDITRFEAKSNDVELHVDFSMTLAQTIDQSAIGGCIRFKGSEALRKREPKTADAISLTGAARHSDGLDHIKLEGTFKEVRKLAKVCGPGTGGGGTDDVNVTGKGSRPSMTVTEEPSKPTVTTPPPGTTIDAGLAHPPDATLYAPTPPTAIPPATDHAGSGSAAPGEQPAAPEGAGNGSG